MSLIFHYGHAGSDLHSPIGARWLLATTLLIGACDEPAERQVLLTIADASSSPARFVDTGAAGDSAGDLLVFDQPLLNGANEPIGTNSGFCVRTEPGVSFQCQWTLIMPEGSIQIAGREFDMGESTLSIVGGTGSFRTIIGEMTSKKNGDGNFVQTLRYQVCC